MNSENDDRIHRPDESQLVEPDPQSELDELLDQFGDGWRLVIFRTKPARKKGYLETIEFEPHNVMDLDYLAHTWGGHQLKIQLKDPKGKIRKSKLIDMYNHPPKMDGTPIRNNPIDLAGYPEAAGQYPYPPIPPWPHNEPRQLAEVRNTPQAPAQDMFKLFQQFMDFHNQTRKNDVSIVQRMVGKGEAGVSKDPLQQLRDTAATFNELKDIFSLGEAREAHETTVQPNEEMNLFGNIMEVVKLMQPQQAAPAPRPHQPPPRAPLPPRTAPQPPQPAPVHNPAPAPAHGMFPPPGDLAKFIAGMPAEAS